jgi:iron complex outermembrane receptor protein
MRNRRLNLKTRLLLSAAIAIPGVHLPQLVLAQGAGPAIEEITVSARRRNESMQDVPISVSAFSGEDLKLRNVETGRDLGAMVPNMMMGAGSLGQAESNIRIRGVPDVGVYLDGVWQGSRGILQANLVELQRVEVLRGPQGTLFGRNTNGGAIQYVSELPGDEFGGNIEIGAGKFKRRDIKVSVDIPLAETLSTKWTAARYERNGYLESVSPYDKDGTRYDDRNDTFLRGDILWDVTPDFSARLTAFNSRQHNTEARQVRFSFQEGAEWFTNVHINAINWLMAQPGTQFPAPSFTPEHYEAGWPGGDVGKWQTKAREPADAMVNNSSDATLTLKWDLGNDLALESISAYRTRYTHQLSLQDAADFVACCRDNRYYDDKVFSEEMHLTGNLFDGAVNFLLGGYYSNATNKLRLYRWWMTSWYVPDGNGDGNPDLNMDLLGQVRAYGESIGDAGLASYAPLGFWVADNHIWYKDREKEKAIFGEVDWSITSKLQLTLGARFSWKDVVQDQFRPGPNDAPALFVDPGIMSPTEQVEVGAGNMWAGTPIPPAVPGINEVHVNATFTPKLSLRYNWTDNLMTYLTYSEGFAEGEVTYVSALDQLFALQPEIVKSYEAGFKSEMLNRSLRFNGDVFYSKWDNLRVSRHPIDPTTGLELPTPFNTDDGKAEVYGFETELAWYATEALHFNFNGGYLKSKYLEIGDPDVSSLRFGSAFAFAPEWSFSAGAQYDLMLPNQGLVTFRGDYGWQSSYERDPSVFRQRDEPEPSYGLLNLQVRYTAPDENWSLALWGSNLTNEHYVDGGFVSAGIGISLDTIGPPREYGVKLEYNF